MRVGITGSHGLVGSAVIASLEGDGHEIVRLPRRVAHVDEVAGVDAVVHLAGESIFGLWTKRKRERILDSRVAGTHALASTIAAMDEKPSVLVCASAVGYYGARGEELLTEQSSAGDGFLADVVVAWEASAQPARDAGVRTVNLRFGIIQSRRGGMLKVLRIPFRLALGGRIGNGRQWFPWTTLRDVVAAIRLAIDNDQLEGPANVVAPEPSTNRDYTKALGAAVHRPTPFPIPRFLLKLVLRDQADDLFASQLVEPTKLRSVGFQWSDPQIGPALERELQGASRE
jgi:uncharacterized protein (TIGR01777 family)